MRGDPNFQPKKRDSSVASKAAVIFFRATAARAMDLTSQEAAAVYALRKRAGHINFTCRQQGCLLHPEQSEKDGWKTKSRPVQCRQMDPCFQIGVSQIHKGLIRGESKVVEHGSATMFSKPSCQFRMLTTFPQQTDRHRPLGIIIAFPQTMRIS